MQAPKFDKIGSSSVLFVMAVPMEYGEALKARITPLMCGVGPVEAALNVARGLELSKANGGLPDYLISLGSAGSHKLEQSAVYQVTSVAYRDMDASPLGFTKGVTPFEDHEINIPLETLLDDHPAGTLSTGANIVNGAAYDVIDADMVDMETFAIKRVADQFGVPLAGFRGISDGKAPLEKYEDWTLLLHDIDEKLGEIVDRLSEHL